MRERITDIAISEVRGRMEETASLSGIVDAIMVVAMERKKLLEALRAALGSGNTEEALKLARLLCGMIDGEKSH